MKVRDAREYLESVYKARIENLMNAVKEELPEDYILFLKVKSHYVKIRASGTTTYTRLTRLRTACWLARRLFGKPLKELTREEWEVLSSELYSMYNTKDAIVSAIHPLRLVLKFLGYDERDIKELFPYPSSIHAKMSSKSSPPYVPGYILDKVIFSIRDDMYRALFCLMRITGGRIEEITLLRRENIINDEDTIYIRFDVTKNGLPREVPINWPEFAEHLKIFIAWYKHQHPKLGDPKAWLFPRKNDLSRPVGRNFAYLVLKRTARHIAKRDPEVARYIEYIHPHQFRHTRAYELVFRNWNIRWIMYYMGWSKVEMVLRYTRAFELKQVYKMLNGRDNNNGSNIKLCPRCHSVVPEGAKYCPYCGLKLDEHDIEKIIQRRKDKEQIKKLLLKFVEEIGVDTLKEILVSH